MTEAMIETTRGYEALVILKVGSEQDVARHAAHLEDPIKKVGGRLDTSQSMGRRKLAFRIARHTEGYYYLLRFDAPTWHVVELERLFRLNEAVVRFMILSADEVAPPAHAAAATGTESTPQPAAPHAASPTGA